ANAGVFGGGMRLVPEARIDDGELDVVTLAPIGRPRFLRFFPRVFNGTHTSIAELSFERARRIRVEAADQAIVAYADGEPVGHLPLDVRIEPRAVTLLVPKKPIEATDT